MKGRIWEVYRISYREVIHDLGAVLRRDSKSSLKRGAGSSWEQVEAVWASGAQQRGGSGVVVLSWKPRLQLESSIATCFTCTDLQQWGATL